MSLQTTRNVNILNFTYIHLASDSILVIICNVCFYLAPPTPLDPQIPETTATTVQVAIQQSSDVNGPIM